MEKEAAPIFKRVWSQPPESPEGFPKTYNEKEAAPIFKRVWSQPLFFDFGFFTVKSFGFWGTNSGLKKCKKRASDRNRRPVLTSETTKRKMSNIFLLNACS